jgi:PleD family two-component response regulator
VIRHDLADEAVRVLLVSADAGMTGAVRAALPVGAPLRAVGRLADALAELDDGEVDLVLLDLVLPDAAGLPAWRSLAEHAGGLPVLVLAPAGDPAAGRAVAEGASDHLATEPFEADLAARVLRHAVAEAGLAARVRRLALVDGPTGLASARALATVGPHLLALAGRTGQKVTVVHAGLEAPPDAEEAPTRPERERALVALARVMRRTFRSADLIARVGDGDLAVLLVHEGDDRSAVARLEEALATLDSPGRPWRLALRLGVVRAAPGEASLAALLARAAAAARARPPRLAPRFGAGGST